MASLNTNIGPERVEVTNQPIGAQLIQGSATAITSLIISTVKADAPLNTPTTVTSLSEFESLFGTQAQIGEAYLSVKGFYDNAGTGAQLIIVAVEPSGVTGSVLEKAQNQDARTITGAVGSLKDEAVMVSGITLTTYVASTGIATLNLGAAIPTNIAKIKVGDYLRDAAGRLLPISAILSSTTIRIEKNLDAQLVKSAKGISANGTSGLAIVRLYSENKYASKTLVQEGDLYGADLTASVSGVTVTLTAFDTYLNAVKTGDILVDSVNEEFVVVEIVSPTEVKVDKEGLTAGVVDLYRGVKSKVVQSTTMPGATFLALGVAPFESAAGMLKFNLANSSNNPAEDILAGYYLTFGSEQYKITANKIVATSTVITGPTAANISYVASTGVVTFPAGTTLITDGAKAGDVLVDASGKEYVLQAVLTELTARIKKNLASPNPLPNAKVNKGAVKISFTEQVDLEAKLDTAASPDTSGVIKHAANKMVVAASTALASDDYLIMEPAVESVDYMGSEADFSGLHALDNIDAVNLIAIPGIFDPAVQIALINYCTVTRKDCFALLSIPDFITSAANDTLVVSNLSISTVQESENGSIVAFSGSPDLSAVSSYDMLNIGGEQFPIKAVGPSEVLVFATSGIPTVGAVSIQKPCAVTWKDVVVNTPSTKAAWYYNHLLVNDVDGNTVLCDPCGHVAGVMARIDANIAQGGISHAPAGIQLAQLAGTVGLQLSISERVEGGPLRLAFINRITSSTGNGRYIFGGYTAGGTSVTADEQLIQVMRSTLFIKTSLEKGLIGFIWENNDNIQRSKIENAIINFLRANSYLFPAGLPEASQFQVESVTPTDLALAQGLVEVKVKVRFNTSIRFIDIELSFPLPVSA